MNIDAATGAARAFKEALNGNVVSPAEIIRRERICAACPKRQPNRGVATAISRRLGLLANKHRVPTGAANYMCGVCKCSLMLLLPATPEDFPKDTPEEKAARPANCWLTE